MRLWSSGAVGVVFVASVAGAQDARQFTASVQALVVRRADTVERAVARDAVERLYQRSSLRPFWSVFGRGPTRQALASLDVLESADAKGLPVVVS